MKALDWVQAVAAVLTPIAVAWLVYLLSHRRSRNDELIRARLDYYRDLVPDLNDLMCYFTFIGCWHDMEPPAVVALKRRLDKKFFCAAPLFSPAVSDRYATFLGACFQTFNQWGRDARMCTSPYRRRQAHASWDSSWDEMFVYSDSREISGDELMNVRKACDALLVSLVTDIDINDARDAYTTDLVSLNAHAPRRQPISGGSVH